MDRSITRRDFINGVSVAVTGSVLASSWLSCLDVPDFAPEKAPGYYPPALTGMRGSHPGSFEAAHRLRDGKSFDPSGAMDTGESFDLVVVGGGISGLAAAYFFRREKGPEARILVLDNHDDFGGHAKRNEFQAGGRLCIGYGGTQSLEGPSSYSPEAKQLLAEIGIDVQRFHTAYDRELYGSLGLGWGIFFDRETFGEDRMLRGPGARRWPEYQEPGSTTWHEFLARAPLSEEARRDIARLYEESIDYLPDLTVEQKMERLRRTSYLEFLTKIARVHPDALPFFQTSTDSLWAIGIDGVPALECWEEDYPGFSGLGLNPPTGKEEPYIYHFPDGNASVARLLVRALNPDAVPGSTMEDVVTARVDYALLDTPARPVKVRLNSTVVRVAHAGEIGSAREVDVAYVRGGQPHRVKAKACVLACYNSIIPHLCPEMPAAQRQAILYAVKMPLVYTNVLIRDWSSFEKLGVQWIRCPGSYHTSISLDFPVSLGDYSHPRRPDEPMILHLVRVPLAPGRPPRDQWRAGRRDLLRTSFETFERNIRDQLGRALADGGFDPARDIQGITVNRWPHGYAYEHNPLFDPDWSEEERPWVIGRKPFGRIAIANSDAAAAAYTDAAIDQAHRAVRELLG
ncbi:MAG: FAD-dependent oxidoreductase [Acidobacteria bacterium]|nr:FAD-dependent oxidoreductase [Acidobacteriota bacterium]